MPINLCNSSSDTCSPISQVSLVISTLCSCRKEKQEDQNIKGKSSEYKKENLKKAPLGSVTPSPLTVTEERGEGGPLVTMPSQCQYP